MFQTRHKTHHSAMGEGKKYLLGMKKAVEVLNVPNESNENIGTIYIHVPFSSKICSFCNMRRSLEAPRQNYSNLIIEEIKNYKELEYIKTTTFDAVYFGGGTPNTLEAKQLCEIIKGLKESFTFTEDAEFTVETTVSELHDDKIESLVEMGINRFSVGVQTFNDREENR